MVNALITGNSSGLGQGITQALLDRGYSVYGCSRRGCQLSGDLHDICCDLLDFEAVPKAMASLTKGVDHLDLVVLNAGILGEIKEMSETSLDELRHIMDINVWANKVVLDWLLRSDIQVDQILLMSSGAAVLGNKGWGGYALSKASLNMLGRLYAHEFPNTHVASIAPGLIDTQMIDYLCTEADSEKYSALQRIQSARETGVVLSPLEAAERIIQALDELKKFESGSFIDLREILAPEEYAELMKARNKTKEPLKKS